MEQLMRHPPDYSATVKIILDESACDGCGLCVDFCPVGVLEMNDGLPKVVKLKACYDCGTREDLCPGDGIHVEPRKTRN
jgi:2-oxoglutarate ferredoxin oxidoreductase subunit delta